MAESGTLWTLSTDLARQTQGFGFRGGVCGGLELDDDMNMIP